MQAIIYSKHSLPHVKTKVSVLTFQYSFSERCNWKAGSVVGSPRCVSGIDWVSLILGFKYSLFSTNRSKHFWFSFQKSSCLSNRETSRPRQVPKEEHFPLPLNELGHCWSWRIFFSITVMKLEGCFCSRWDTCWRRQGGPGKGAWWNTAPESWWNQGRLSPSAAEKPGQHLAKPVQESGFNCSSLEKVKRQNNAISFVLRKSGLYSTYRNLWGGWRGEEDESCAVHLKKCH